jgi:hypothetical protein
MNKEDYDVVRAETRVDRTKPAMLRCAQGLIMLKNLWPIADDMVAEKDVIYASGPPLEDLKEADARQLITLGWRHFDSQEDCTYTFFT